MINTAGKMWLRIKRLRRERNIRTGSSRLWHQFVAHTPHSQDALRMVWVCFQLLAQPADVYVYHLWLTDELRAPNLAEQVISSDHGFGLGSQRKEEIELARRKVQKTSAAGNGMGLRIDLKISHHEMFCVRIKR